MVDNRKSLLESASILGSNLSKIGAQIKENKVNARKQSILESFNNPDKIFFNPDGSSKDPIETRSKVTNGAMELLMLGDKNLASGLLNYYGEVEKNLTRRATNSAYRNILGDKGQVLNGADADRVDTTKFNGIFFQKDATAGKTQTRQVTHTNVKGEDGKYYDITYAFNPMERNAKFTEVLRTETDPKNIRYSYGHNTTSVFSNTPERFQPATIKDKNGNEISGFVGDRGTTKDMSGKILNSNDYSIQYKQGTDTPGTPPTGQDNYIKARNQIMKNYSGYENRFIKQEISDYLDGGIKPSWWDKPGYKQLRDQLYNMREGKYEFSR